MLNMRLAMALCLFPAFCIAEPTLDIAITSCAGSYSSDIANVITLNCTGDFYVAQGTVTADKKIVITASGVVTLDNLTLTAPEIDLKASGLVLNSGLVIATNALTATSGSSIPYVGAGATISFGGATPIPMTSDMLSTLTSAITPINDPGKPVIVAENNSLELQSTSSGNEGGGGAITFTSVVVLLLVCRLKTVGAEFSMKA